MTKTKKTAKATPKDVTITGAKLSGSRGSDVSYPVATFKGDVPNKGAKLTLKMENGSVYTGKVTDATDIDGMTICEFAGGLTPSAKK